MEVSVFPTIGSGVTVETDDRQGKRSLRRHTTEILARNVWCIVANKKSKNHAYQVVDEFLFFSATQ